MSAAALASSCGKSRESSDFDAAGSGGSEVSGHSGATTGAGSEGQASGGATNGAAGTGGGPGQAGATAEAGSSSGAQGGEGPGEPTSGPKLLATLGTLEQGGHRNLRADAGELYWRNSDTIWSVERTTGVLGEFHAPGCLTLGGFDLDSDEVFIAGCDAIVAVSRSAPNLRTVTRGRWLDLAKLGDKLFMVQCRDDVKGMLAVPDPPEAKPSLSLGFDTNSCYTNIIAGGSLLYLSKGVQRHDVATGETLSLSPGRVLDADGTNAVIAVEDGQNGVTSLGLVDSNGAEDPLFAPDLPGRFGGGCLNQGAVYYTYTGDAGDTRRLEVGRVTFDGAHEVLVTSEYAVDDGTHHALGSITADDDAIYWEEGLWDEAEVGTTRLFRLDK